MREATPAGSIASFLGRTSAILLAAAVIAIAPAPQTAHAATAKHAVTPPKKPATKAAVPVRKPAVAGKKTLPAAKPAAKPTVRVASRATAARPASKPVRASKGKPAANRVVPGRAKGFLSLPAAKARPAAYRAVSAAATAEAPTSDRRIIALVEEDETLIDVLVREDVTPDDMIAAIDAFEELEERARLAPGDRIELIIDGANHAGERNLTALRIVRSSGSDVTLVRSADGTFTAASPEANGAVATMVTMTGTVSGSWQGSLAAADVPPALVREVDRLIALDLDLPRPVPAGASFEILAERRDGRGGDPSHIVRFVGVNVAGYDHRIYRYMPQDGAAGYFDEHGRSVAPLTLKMPIEDGRLTSEFGWRRHPKLKRRMFHRGIDLAAPVGTPIMASADGTVEWVGWRGAYGRYIRVNHGSGLSTGYGHLSDYASGIAEGTTVRQGQVIGYLGSSGRSTGPHVDFSVLVDGRPVNPMHALMPAPRDLQGPELVAFNEQIAQLRGLAQATP